jgi:hypothetical protein
MEYDLHKAINGMFHVSLKRNCFDMKEWKKGKRRRVVTIRWANVRGGKEYRRVKWTRLGERGAKNSGKGTDLV